MIERARESKERLRSSFGVEREDDDDDDDEMSLFIFHILNGIDRIVVAVVTTMERRSHSLHPHLLTEFFVRNARTEFLSLEVSSKFDRHRVSSK